MKVLIADDFDLNRKVMHAILSHEGIEVFEASDGLEALEILDREPIRVIVSDILMPNMDGYRFCAEVRRNAKFRETPFIFYTSTYTSPSDEKLALELGADKFLRKPVTAQALIDAIQAVASRPPSSTPRSGSLPAGLDLTGKYTHELISKLEEKNEELFHRTRELHEASARLGAVIRAAPAAIIAFDLDGRVQTWNPAAEQIFGWPEAEVLAKPLPNLGAEVLTAFAALRERAQAGEMVNVLEIQGQKRDGKTLSVELSGAPLYGAEGRITGHLAVLADVTAQRLAREALRQSEQRFAAFMDHQPTYVWMKDLDGRYVYVNKRTAQLEQFRNGWKAKSDIDLCAPEIAVEYRANDRQVAATGQAMELLEPFRVGDETRFMLVSKFPILDPSGKVVLIGGAGIDITERIQTEKALRESEVRFRQLADNIDAVFWVKSAENGRLEFVSRAYERIWRRSIKSLLENRESWREAIIPEDRDRMAREVEAQRLGSEFESTYRILWPDGDVRWIRDRGFPVRDAAGNLIRVAGIAEDITERKRSEQQFENIADMLQILTTRLFAVQEEERRNLARELHDEIGQSLTAAKMEIEAARQLENPAARALRLEDGLAVIEHLLQSVRALSLDLRPALLDEVGLAAALKAHVQSHAARAEILARVDVDESIPHCDPAIAIACFRVAQEALTNVLRHSRAKLVEVSLHGHGDELRLRVRDNGVGFDVSAAEARVENGESFGLLSMRERANLAGGRFVCRSNIGQGSTIEADFPLVPR